MKTTIDSAIAQWQTTADRNERIALGLSLMGGDPSLIRDAVAQSLEARRVVESLQKERATGIPHCSCTNPPHPFKH